MKTTTQFRRLIRPGIHDGRLARTDATAPHRVPAAIRRRNPFAASSRKRNDLTGPPAIREMARRYLTDDRLLARHGANAPRHG